MKGFLKAAGSVIAGGLLLFSIAGQAWALAIVFLILGGISIAYNWTSK